MCGIVGFIDYSKQSTIDVLKNCANALAHRGPDGEGFSLDETSHASIGLAHRRLSIIDLSPLGSQPMHYRHFIITYNGEIYNYQEIKNELIEKGHVFISHADTEVILHAFEEWGTEMLHKFIGMFAFVIFDSQKNEITCVRDRAGIKPFYYYQTDDLFLFASELKAFHQHPAFVKKIDQQALSAYFTYGYIPAPLTIFENTHKLEPGHFLNINLATRQFLKTPYWDVYHYYQLPKLNISEAEAKIETNELLQSACAYRMVADVPVGVFLSGGYDSTLVTAILQKQQSSRLKTFTIGFEEEAYNEANFARQVANYLGTDHTEYICTKNEAQALVPELGTIFDEPFADNSNIPTILVSKLAKKSVTVALSADAGDELFAGYTTYNHVLAVYNKIKGLPISIQRMIQSGFEIANFAAWPGLKNKATLIHKLSRCLPANTALEVHKNLAAIFDRNELKNLLSESVTSTSFADKQLHHELGSLESLLAYDYQHYMADDILVKVDKATMSAGLEGREPLLDHRLLELTAQLPTSLKLKDGINKYLLKEITHDYVPKEMMDRKKKGFTLPVHDWMHTSLKPLLEDTLAMNKQATILNNNYVDHLLKLYYKNPEDKTMFQKIWLIFNFKLWYNRWM